MPKRTCSFPDCDRPVNGRGLCLAHYKQQWRGQALRPLIDRTLTDEQRFWAKVTKTETCWTSSANPTHDGYARITADGARVYAHRFSYELLVGPIPDGMLVDHICFVPNCVRPDHLRLVTKKQNQEHLSGALSNSKTGVRGVHWDEKNQRYIAFVTHNGKSTNLGRYDSIEEADAVVRAKRSELFTHDDAEY